VIQCDLIHLANGGLGMEVLENLKAFLYALFVTKVSETKTTLVASSVSECSRKGMGIAHFCEKDGGGQALKLVKFVGWHGCCG